MDFASPGDGRDGGTARGNCMERQAAERMVLPDLTSSEPMENRSTVQMQEVTRAAELAEAQKQREQFDRNSAWLQEHVAEIYAKHRGRCICIAGQELFVANTAAEAIAQATAAHPGDNGWFTRYIPREKTAKIYAI